MTAQAPIRDCRRIRYQACDWSIPTNPGFPLVDNLDLVPLCSGHRVQGPLYFITSMGISFLSVCIMLSIELLSSRLQQIKRFTVTVILIFSNFQSSDSN